MISLAADPGFSATFPIPNWYSSIPDVLRLSDPPRRRCLCLYRLCSIHPFYKAVRLIKTTGREMNIIKKNKETKPFYVAEHAGQHVFIAVLCHRFVRRAAKPGQSRHFVYTYNKRSDRNWLLCASQYSTLLLNGLAALNLIS